MKNKKMIISISSMIVILILLLGASYALFAYEGIGTNKSQLIMGDIYMHYKENNQLMISDNDVNNANILPDIKTINKYKVNPVMESQTLGENELSKCVYFLNSYGFQGEEGETLDNFCKGTGTFFGSTLQETLNNGEFPPDFIAYFEENNIILVDADGNYTINSIMATQTIIEMEQENELSLCMEYLISLSYNEELDSGSTMITYCQGTGTAWGGFTFQADIDDDIFDENQIQEMLSQNIIVENKIQYSKFEINSILETQTAEFENELTACVYFFEIYQGWGFDEGSTAETFCRGTGTVDNGILFQELLEEWMIDDEFYFKFFSTNNIIVQDGGSYIVNSDMLNQTVGDLELNELKSCMFYFLDWEFDEGSDAASFCQGTGKMNGLTISEWIASEQKSESFLEEGGMFLLNRNIIIPLIEEYPYFEFTISGKNTYSQANIYYEIFLDHGDPHETRSERIRDDLLRFSLIKIVDGNETIVFENLTFDDIENKRIYSEMIPKNTMDEIDITYRLYMGFYEGIKVGEVGPNSDKTVDYDFDTWNNEIFASVKVNVTGSFSNPYQPEELTGTFVEDIKSKVGTGGLIAINQEGELYDENDPNQEIREYRYSGEEVDNYVVFNNDGDDSSYRENELWRIVGIFKDTIKDEYGNVVLGNDGKPLYEEKIKLVHQYEIYEFANWGGIANGSIYYIVGDRIFEIGETFHHRVYYDLDVEGVVTNNWAEAGIQYYLNTEKSDPPGLSNVPLVENGYLALFSNKARKLIAPTTYYLGNVGNETTISSYESERNLTNIWEGNKSTWTGLVGFLYQSDLGYSLDSSYWNQNLGDFSANILRNSWLKYAANSWNISPSTYSKETVSSGFGWSTNINDIPFYVTDYPALPVLYLVSSAEIYPGGDGTYDNPYVVVEE